MDSTAGTLTPVAPFDFEKTLTFLGGFYASMNDQVVESNALTRAIALNGRAIVFRLSSRGTVDEPLLDYTLYSARKLDAATQAKTVERIRFFLSLDDDLAPFYTRGRRDKKFVRVMQELYGLHQVKFLTPFENAVWAVLSQRTPMGVARKVKQALTQIYGPHLKVDGVEHFAFPEASQLFPVSAGELNTIVNNERKTEYLRAVIEAFHKVDDEFLYHAPTDEVRAWLLSIKGIGEWSAYFILFRGLGRSQPLYFDAKSQPMRAFADVIDRIYGDGKHLDHQAIAKLAAPYGEWESYWTYYLRASG